MADEDTTDDLDISNEDAEKLLDDPDSPDDEPTLKTKPAPSATDDRVADVSRLQSDLDRWKSMSRKNEKAAKDYAEKLRQYEDANKSESERLQEALVTHQSRAERAEAALKRREIAETRAPAHATIAQIKAVAKRLAGDSDSDLEEDADELFALLAPAPAEPKPEPKPKTPSRPQERLRGGGDPDDEPEESDPKKLAALVPRRR